MAGIVYTVTRSQMAGLGLPLHTLPQAQLHRGRPVGRLAISIGDPTAFGGLYRIAGRVKFVDNTPAQRRMVRLHDRPTGICVRTAFTASDGSYEFRFVAFGTYYVMAFDQAGGYNATVEDFVVPAPV